MARAMWKGAIQFGLVTIPVKLYLATESKGIAFNMLHKDDLSRIQMKIVCPVEDEVISRVDTVKGYEYAPGEYVVITDEDLENVPLKTVRSIEIEQFTKAERDDADVRFVKSAYYLEPDKIGRKAFYLLAVRARGRGPDGDLQGRHQGPRGARRARPVRRHDAHDHAPLAGRDPLDGELDLPRRGLRRSSRPSWRWPSSSSTAMTGEFDPAQYKDEYRDALEAVIQAKVEGKETVSVEAPEESGKLIDLMAALEASVKSATTARTAAAGGEPVSVAEVREAGTRRRRRPPRSSAEDAAAKAKAPAKAKAATEASRRRRRRGRGRAPAKPARRRKSA